MVPIDADSEISAADLYHALMTARAQTGRLRSVIFLLAETFDIAETLRSASDDALAERGFSAAEIQILRDALQPLRHFSWLEGFRVAGCARPQSPAGVTALAAEGVRRVVTLTEQPLPALWLAEAGIEAEHVPMPDVLAPHVSSLQLAVAAVERGLRDDHSVAVHCNAGIGRTATVLAAFLVGRGFGVEPAIETVKRARPRSQISPDQRRVLARFFDEVRAAGGG